MCPKTEDLKLSVQDSCGFRSPCRLTKSVTSLQDLQAIAYHVATEKKLLHIDRLTSVFPQLDPVEKTDIAGHSGAGQC